MKVRELKERLATADLEAVVQIHVWCEEGEAWHGKPLEVVEVHNDAPRIGTDPGQVVELR